MLNPPQLQTGSGHVISYDAHEQCQTSSGSGTHTPGRQKKNWTDNVREDCSDTNITLCQGAELAREWTDPARDALFVNRAAVAQALCHYRQGITSSKA